MEATFEASLHRDCPQSCPSLCDPVARHAPPAMGFFRQEYWSGLLLPPPGDLSDPGIKSVSFASPALSDGFFTTVPP